MDREQLENNSVILLIHHYYSFTLNFIILFFIIIRIHYSYQHLCVIIISHIIRPINQYPLILYLGDVRYSMHTLALVNGGWGKCGDAVWCTRLLLIGSITFITKNEKESRQNRIFFFHWKEREISLKSKSSSEMKWKFYNNSTFVCWGLTFFFNFLLLLALFSDSSFYLGEMIDNYDNHRD